MMKYYAVFKINCNTPDEKNYFKSSKLFSSARILDMTLTSKTFLDMDELVDILESKAKTIFNDVVKKIPECNVEIQKFFNEEFFSDVKACEKLENYDEDNPLAFRILVQEFLDDKLFKPGHTLFEADLFVLESDELYEILH